MAGPSTSQATRARVVASQFEDALEDMGVITANVSITFEGGDYRLMHLLPSPQVASTLVTSRELLVLVCPFSNVQTRAIRLAARELKKAGGRLEPGMAVLLHDDIAGSERLREWGREQGLTVLPIFAQPHVPESDDLERELCSGLYAHDPFDLAGPVRAAHQFYGRAEVPDLARRLTSGHIQAIFGIRKIGKTSVLHRLSAEAREFHGMACAFVDCSDDSLSALSAGKLMYSIGGAVDEAVNRSNDYYADVIALNSEIDAHEAARILINQLSAANRPVLLVFDEIDYISPSSPVAKHWANEFNIFLRALRHVYQECARRDIPFSVVVAGVSSRWFSVEAINGVENAALAFVPEGYLSPFTREQSLEMIQTLGRAAGLVFVDTAADHVASTCSDIPFWMRKAGSYINSCFAQSDRPLKVSVPDAQLLSNEFVEVEGAQLAFSSFRHLFRIYPELGPAAVASLEPDGVGRVPQSVLSALGRYGLLGPSMEPSGPMIAAGLRLWNEERVSRPPQLPFAVDVNHHNSVAAGSLSAAGEEEWAELLGEVSRRRNVLERSMRDFVLALLRADVANRQDGRTASDILLAALPTSRRSNLAGATATSILKTYYWLDLMAVVRKNWKIFGKYFGDLKAFELHGEIVNDRPDAHAKDFDGAELALQRRAIDWIESRVKDAGVL